MEGIIGRRLDSHEVVHHRNGDKGGNRAANLELMSLKDHSRSHRKGTHLSHETKTKISAAMAGRRPSNALLADSDVRNVKRAIAAGMRTRDIVALYGVKKQAVVDIKGGRRYAGVAA